MGVGFESLLAHIQNYFFEEKVVIIIGRSCDPWRPGIAVDGGSCAFIAVAALAGHIVRVNAAVRLHGVRVVSWITTVAINGASGAL